MEQKYAYMKSRYILHVYEKTILLLYYYIIIIIRKQHKSRKIFWIRTHNWGDINQRRCIFSD
jgi:hypothetical protein